MIERAAVSTERQKRRLSFQRRVRREKKAGWVYEGEDQRGGH